MALVGGRARSQAGALELECDRARIGADCESEDETDGAHRRGCQPGHDERVELEILAGEQRAEHERAESGSEQRAEEDVRDGARLARLGIHVRHRRSREEHRSVHSADAEEAEDHEWRRVEHAPERRRTAQPTMPTTKPPAITGTRP